MYILRLYRFDLKFQHPRENAVAPSNSHHSPQELRHYYLDMGINIIRKSESYTVLGQPSTRFVLNPSSAGVRTALGIQSG